MRHYLKIPSGNRKSFKIYKRITYSDGSTKNETLNILEVDQINSQLKCGVISFGEAKALAKSLCLRLNSCLGDEFVNISSANQKILEAYWKAEYSDRHLVNAASAKHKLERALRTIEPLSIQIAEKSEMAEKLKKLGNPVRIRQYTSSLNQLLQFAKRDFTLRLPAKPARQTPSHLTQAEFKRMVEGLDQKYQAPAWLAFLSGQRVGEIFAADINRYVKKHNFVDVASQVRPGGEVKEPKHGSVRKAYCLPGYDVWLEIWLSQDRSQVSPVGLSHAITRRCQALWPSDKKKHCSVHDLRHNYAIKLVPIIGVEKVALSLGNSIAVCQEYYSGYSFTDEGIDAVHSKVMTALG